MDEYQERFKRKYEAWKYRVSIDLELFEVTSARIRCKKILELVRRDINIEKSKKLNRTKRYEDMFKKKE